MNYDHLWFWKIRLPERKSKLCRVLVHGRKNSILVEFEDGFRVITSRYAVRKHNEVLKHTFKKVDYIVDIAENQNFTLRIGKGNPQFDEFLKKNNFTIWAFITPQNPQAKKVSESENARLLQELELLLKDRYQYFMAHTKTPSALWPDEYGMCIMNIDLEGAVAIGRNFEQKAIVYGEINRAPQLFFC